MSNYAIRVEGLGKQYHIRSSKSRHGYKSVRDVIASATSWPFRTMKNIVTGSRAPHTGTERFWALQDISFEVEHGEVLGVIGRNGAGKSTLLKLLTRITEPTTGEIRLRGRVGSLLEVGVGFHPELTGRENVYLNGAVLGMTRREITRKFDEIVDFSGVEKFIDTPVKRFSSGMYLRLAFAVAAHLEPEILLVDEVLAVGDAAFQKKCLGKMGEVAGEGRTVLFVSHDMGAVENLCSRAVLLETGHLTKDDYPHAVINTYQSKIYAITSMQLADRRDRRGTGHVQFTRFYLENDVGQPVGYAVSGEPIVFCLAYESTIEGIRDVSVAMVVLDMWGKPLYRNSTRYTEQDFAQIPSEGVFKCRLDELQITGGEYTVDLAVSERSNLADDITEAAKFTVEDGDFYGTGRSERGAAFLARYGWTVKG